MSAGCGPRPDHKHGRPRWSRGRPAIPTLSHHLELIVNQTDPPAAEAEPICKFEQGCHRVVACDPGCGAASAVFPEPPSRAASLSVAERQFLTFALDLAADEMASRGDEFGAEDQAALESLRRMADEAQQQPETEDRHRVAVQRVRESLAELRDKGATGREYYGRILADLDRTVEPAAADSEETRTGEGGHVA